MHHRLAATVVLSACTGTVVGEGPAPAMDLDDGGQASSPPAADGGVAAMRTDGGTSSTPPPMETMTTRSCSEPCGERALCDPEADRCVCIPGYTSEGADCVPLPVDDPTTRTAEAMCDLWVSGRRSWGGPAYEPDPSGATCAPGSLPFAAHMEALSYLNAYRRLSGVGPVTLSTIEGVADAEQACAILQASNSGISHNPPMDWTCWTEEGRAAAGTSYIASGFRSAASTVDGYIRETQSRLSHRRGLLSLGRSNVYFGHYESGGCCRYGGHGDGLPSDPDYVFYPNAGFAPVELFNGKWSVIRGRASTARFVARVFDDATGEELPVDMQGSFEGFSAFSPAGWRAEAGRTYRVELEGETMRVVYRTTPTSCPGR